jgi:hypothetical protein
VPGALHAAKNRLITKTIGHMRRKLCLLILFSVDLVTSCSGCGRRAGAQNLGQHVLVNGLFLQQGLY